MVKRRWTNAEVVSWAQEYLSSKDSFKTLEKRLCVPHSTICWCFQNRLYRIDNRLYLLTLERIDYNKHHGSIRKES